MHRTLVRLAATAMTLAAGIVIVGAGSASAETELPMTRCLGPSPFIVDQPYAPARLWVEQNESGTVTLALRDVASLWFFAGGYQSQARLDWRNPATGASGTEFTTQLVGYPGGQPGRFHFVSGPGPVELTLSAFNWHALWGVPSTSCTGVVQVR
ncbi:hypothetical protein [Aldersonia kunmingensis]|uniref:hypothetical protein n=1 Tax=Aldersonia kunmingensis TaxID=408066 RepID=UPI0008334696|nr:hypothetical protein [Aldersonia kunmingensis]